MFCKNCGSQLAENSKFCSNCGLETEKSIDTNSMENLEESSNAANEKSNENTNSFQGWYQQHSEKLFLVSFSSAAFGVILFLGIVLISLIGWGKIYLYGGYDVTATLTTISLFFMLLGLVVLSPIFIVNQKSKSIIKLTEKTFSSLTIVLITLCIIFSIWCFIDYANEQNSSSFSDGSSYNSSYNDYYSSGVNKNIGLSLKVDNIKVSGNYTYVYCTVTNVSSKYIATKYRYVKVKAQFKNSSGAIVDTDWTYAIDSTWLDPGESKSFHYMVQNTNIKSATLSFVD